MSIKRIKAVFFLLTKRILSKKPNWFLSNDCNNIDSILSIYFFREGWIKSWISTFRTFAIWSSVGREGWFSFVHQRETVLMSFFNCLASHLLVLPFSTKTTFILLRGSFFIYNCKLCQVIGVQCKYKFIHSLIKVYKMQYICFFIHFKMNKMSIKVNR